MPLVKQMEKSRVFISTTCLKRNLFEAGVPEYVTGVEFSGGFAYRPIREFRKLLSKVKYSGKNILIHGYFPPQEKSFILNFASIDQELVNRSLSLAENALGLCSEFGLPYYSFHPGYLSTGYENSMGNFIFNNTSFIKYETALSNFKRNFERLYSLSQRYCVKLAVENLFINRGNIKDSLNNSFDEIEELMLLLPKDTGLLLDLGHMNVSANYMNFSRESFLSKYIKTFGDRLYELHLSENDGDFDTHNKLSSNSWQLFSLSLFRRCPGVSGNGVNITLESRNLEDETLKENLHLIDNFLSDK